MIRVKKGHADWYDLVGKTVSFRWSDGWEEFHPQFEFSHTEAYSNEGYPSYYICGKGGGGYSVGENEKVEVMIHD